MPPCWRSFTTFWEIFGWEATMWLATVRYLSISSSESELYWNISVFNLERQETTKEIWIKSRKIAKLEIKPFHQKQNTSLERERVYHVNSILADRSKLFFRFFLSFFLLILRNCQCNYENRPDCVEKRSMRSTFKGIWSAGTSGKIKSVSKNTSSIFM